MEKKKLLFFIVCGLLTNQTIAQYTIKTYSINSGGGAMSGGTYQLQGSIGQVDASVPMAQGDYSLTGGFWQQNNDLIYKNGFE